MADPVIVCPTEEELLIATQRNIACLEEGCGRQFATLPALWMHSAKTHRIYKDDWHKEAFFNNQGKRRASSVTRRFLCPVAACGRKKLFDRLAALKAHYTNVHAEKKFSCPKCGRKFGAERTQELHTASCGQILRCSCGTPYTTPEALYMHAKRQNHELTEDFKQSRKYRWKRKDLEAECHGEPQPQIQRTHPPASQPLLLPKGPVFILHQIVRLPTVNEGTQTKKGTKKNRHSKCNHPSPKREKSHSKEKGSSKKRKCSSERKSGRKALSSKVCRLPQSRHKHSKKHAENSADGQETGHTFEVCSSKNIVSARIPQQLPQGLPNRQNLTGALPVASSATQSNNGDVVTSSMAGPFSQSSASNASIAHLPLMYMNDTTSVTNALPRDRGISSFNGLIRIGSVGPSRETQSSFTSDISVQTRQRNSRAVLRTPFNEPCEGLTRTEAVVSQSFTLNGINSNQGTSSEVLEVNGINSNQGTPTEVLGTSGAVKHSAAVSPSGSSMNGLVPSLAPSANTGLVSRSDTNSPATGLLRDLQMLQSSNCPIEEPSADSTDSIGFRSIGTSLETLGVPTQTDFDILDLLTSCDIQTQTIESIFAANPAMETSGTQTQENNVVTNCPVITGSLTNMGNVLELGVNQASVLQSSNGAQTLVDNTLDLGSEPTVTHTQNQQMTSTGDTGRLGGSIPGLSTNQISMQTQTQHTPLTNEAETLIPNVMEIGTNQPSVQTRTQQMPLTNEAQTLVGDVLELSMNHVALQTQTQQASHSNTINTQTPSTSQGLHMRTVELQTMTHSTIATSPCPDTPTPLEHESQETQTMAILSSQDLLSLDIYTQTGLGDLTDHSSLDDLEFTDIHTQTMNDFDLGVFGIDGTSTSVQTDFPLVRSHCGVTVGTQVQSQFLNHGMVSETVQTDKSASGATPL